MCIMVIKRKCNDYSIDITIACISVSVEDTYIAQVLYLQFMYKRRNKQGAIGKYVVREN